MCATGVISVRSFYGNSHWPDAEAKTRAGKVGQVLAFAALPLAQCWLTCGTAFPGLLMALA